MQTASPDRGHEGFHCSTGDTNELQLSLSKSKSYIVLSNSTARTQCTYPGKLHLL